MKMLFYLRTVTSLGFAYEARISAAAPYWCSIFESDAVHVKAVAQGVLHKNRLERRTRLISSDFNQGMNSAYPNPRTAIRARIMVRSYSTSCFRRFDRVRYLYDL